MSVTTVPTKPAGRPAAPTPRQPVTPGRPWTDRGGSFSPFKASVFALLFVPALWLALAFCLDDLGARPLKEAIHQSGLMACRLLLMSLLVTPARALLAWPGVLAVRRMIGVAAATYAAAHLVLWVSEQNWHLLHAAAEIVRRFYLTVGFVALAGLVVLAATSTNASMRRLGTRWKLLHRLAYALAALAVFHFFLQSKANVGEAVLYGGVFVWAMLWRTLPDRFRRSLPALAGLALVAALLTAGLEYAWYGLATHIPPGRVLGGELDLDYGPHPAGQILMLGLAVLLAVVLRRVTLAPDSRSGPALAARDAAFSSGAALLMLLVVWTFSLGGDSLPDQPAGWVLALAWLALGAAAGMARFLLRGSRSTLAG